MERADAEALDRGEPLRAVRDRFTVPEGVVYLDGNSLGALQPAVADAVELAVRQDWGRGLIRAWNTTGTREHPGPGWVDLPRRVAAALAPLVGADADELAVADSTTVDLFKVLVGLARLRPDRRVIVTEERDFPTDRYVATGVAELLDLEVRTVPADGLASALDGAVAVLAVSEVDYRTGARHDVAALTETAHEAGALTVWDLSHSTGALDVDVHRWDVDAAVGCTYKYLNGGPGAPAYLYLARRHHDAARSPVAGWFGHARPFDFAASYEPADGAARFLAGTPPVLSMVALEAALRVQGAVAPADRAAKVGRLTDLFVELVDRRCEGLGLEVVTPRRASERGAQVSLRHADAYPVMRALIDRGVIGDHRPPDLLRFGFPPLYVRHVDVWDAVEVLRHVLTTGAWRDPAYRQRQPVV